MALREVCGVQFHGTEENSEEVCVEEDSEEVCVEHDLQELS